MAEPEPERAPVVIADTPSAAETMRQCRYCCGSIARAAKVCQICGRHQSAFWQHFRIEQVGILVSVIMMSIAFAQLREARSERVAASEAVTRAQRAERNVVALNNALREQFLLVAELTWLQVETKNEFGTARANLAIQEILKDLNAILPQVLPDPAQRKRWVEALEKRLSPRK